MNRRQRQPRVQSVLSPGPIPGAPPTLSQAFSDIVRRVPEAEAVVGEASRYTYAELEIAVLQLAAVLAGMGLGPGDRLAMAASVRPEVMIAFLASQHLGAIWVGINPALAPAEIALQLEHCDASVLIVEVTCLSRWGPESKAAIQARLILLDSDGPDDWRALVAAGENGPTPHVAPIDATAAAAIAYTSGTTGRPKGAVHSQHNILAAVISRLAGVQAFEGPTDIRRGAAMGLVNLNALVRTGLTALLSGGCLVCIPRRDAKGIAAWVERETVQAISLPGAVLHDLLVPEIPPRALASLHLVGNAGSPVTGAVKSRYEAKFGHPVLMAYGQTEALTVLSAGGIDRPIAANSSGWPCGHLDLAILKADGARATAGEVGEICARARADGAWANVWRPMLGYWGGASDEAALADGWLHTGDLGHLGDDGQLFVTGRLKDLIIRGGANIYAADVERVIASDPRVRGVAVIGRTDARLGETVAAVVELAEGLEPGEAIAEDLRHQSLMALARYKVPEAWAFAERLPRTASGKVIKRDLAATYFSDEADRRLVCTGAERR